MSEQSQGESGDSGMQPHSRRPGGAAGTPESDASLNEELARVRAEKQRYGAQSDTRGRARAALIALSMRLERALRDAEVAVQRAERAESVVAGLRRAFYLRRMSPRRRLVRRLLPKAFRSWWDERNLVRLESVIRKSGLFDQAWYRSAYPETERSGLNPIRHYLMSGAAEGRRPRPDFDPDAHLAQRPMLAFLGLDPFVDYVTGPVQERIDQAGCHDGWVDEGAVRDGHAGDEPLFDIDEPEGCFNDGWYGSRRLTDEQRFSRSVGSQARRAASDERLRVATGRMARRFHPPRPQCIVEIMRKAAPLAVIGDLFRRTEADAALRLSAAQPRYAVVTACPAVDESIANCARSMKALIEADLEVIGFARISWIVVTDTDAAPSGSLAPLFAGLPVVFLRSAPDEAEAAGARYAVAELEAEWVFSIAPNEEIEPATTLMLDYYSANFPSCRCIIASPVDIDEDAIVLRWNRSLAPVALFEHDMPTSQFVAVRSDLLADRTRPFDYEAILCLSLSEPVLSVPEYLHRHQWRAGTPAKPAGRCQQPAQQALRGFLRRLGETLPAPEARHPRLPARVTAGLCIIRTQGTRLNLLAETIRSVLAQTVAIRPCVVVHGPLETEIRIKSWLDSQQLNATVLSAPDVARRRGHPLNVGLAHLMARHEDYDFAFFLDDDDIIHPLYGERLTALLDHTGCDIGVCFANSRILSQPPQLGHPILPIAALVAGNFIPIHCYVVRTHFFLQGAFAFDETMDYLEDWDFLVQLLAANGRFALLPEVLCEYRIIGDGNQHEKRDPEHFERCRQAILERGRLAASRLGLGRLVRDLANFDVRDRPDLSPAEIDRLIEVRRIFEAAADERGP